MWLIPNKAFKVADSQVATRWGNISDFKNFDLITPNEKKQDLHYQTKTQQ